MEYGKVKVTNSHNGYTVSVGCGNNEIYQFTHTRKDHAYSDAKFIRGLIKLGKHPLVSLQNMGYTLTA